MVAGELADDGAGFRYPIVVVSVPRRAGKTVLVLGTGLDRLDIEPMARCWYTAQRGADAGKQFRDEWIPMIEGNPRLASRYRLYVAPDRIGIYKLSGSSRLQLFPPIESALHGMNADLVVVDEAWYFDTDQGEAIEAAVRPAQLTRPWRQLWIVSAGGTINSTWWDRWLAAGQACTKGVALFDWGADPNDPDYDPGNPAIWAQAHPALGHGIDMAALETEWATRRDDASFERSILNVWPRPSLAVATAGLELGAWSAAARPELAPNPVSAIAFDVAADRSSAALAVAGVVGDRVVVEVVDHRPGVRWLAEAIRGARMRWRGVPVVADSIVAASTVAELARVRVSVDPVGAGDHARACGTFLDLLGAGRLAHRSQAVLDDAVHGAARRPLGDAWLWSRARSSVDISPLVAVTLAAWAAHARKPSGRAEVGAVAPATLPQDRRTRPSRQSDTRTFRTRP